MQLITKQGDVPGGKGHARRAHLARDRQPRQVGGCGPDRLHCSLPRSWHSAAPTMRVAAAAPLLLALLVLSGGAAAVEGPPADLVDALPEQPDGAFNVTKLYSG